MYGHTRRAILPPWNVVLNAPCSPLLPRLNNRLTAHVGRAPAAAYSFNPIHDSHMMSEGWEALRARRQAILDVRDKKDLKKWKA